jgi:molybdate transport system regulatory protein
MSQKSIFVLKSKQDEFLSRKTVILHKKINPMPVSHLKLNYKFWIETDSGESILGEGKWRLLKAIKEKGSLQAAVIEMGYTYRKTWETLKRIEEKLGFKIIEKSRGGDKGGQTVLTPKGERLIVFFDKLYGQIEPDIEQLFGEMISELNELVD